MASCGKTKDPQMREKIQRIIGIWEQRQVFTTKFILALRQSLTKAEPITVSLSELPVITGQIFKSRFLGNWTILTYD